MQTNNYLAFLCSLTILSTALNASQAIEREKQLTIVNETSDKIEIGFIASENKEIITLDAGRQCTFQLMTLEELAVVPYGRLKGWLNKEAVTAGRLQADNHAHHPVITAAKDLIEDCCIAIKPGGIEDTGIISRLYNVVASRVLPYRLEPLNDFIPRIRPLRGAITEFFPQVEKAYNEGLEIAPRYFLRLPEHASEEEIHAAYTRADAPWRKMMLSSSKNSKRILAASMIRLLNEVCKKMLNRENEYDFQLFSFGLSNNEFIQNMIPPVHLSASESDSSTEDN